MPRPHFPRKNLAKVVKQQFISTKRPFVCTTVSRPRPYLSLPCPAIYLCRCCTFSIVSWASTSSVIVLGLRWEGPAQRLSPAVVLPVSVFTKICIAVDGAGAARERLEEEGREGRAMKYRNCSFRIVVVGPSLVRRRDVSERAAFVHARNRISPARTVRRTSPPPSPPSSAPVGGTQQRCC